MKYQPRHDVRCSRCDALMSRHRDGQGRFTGCPLDALIEPRACAYQGCTVTVIEDVPLWLCAEHLPTRTLR